MGRLEDNLARTQYTASRLLCICLFLCVSRRHACTHTNTLQGKARASAHVKPKKQWEDVKLIRKKLMIIVLLAASIKSSDAWTTSVECAQGSETIQYRSERASKIIEWGKRF